MSEEFVFDIILKRCPWCKKTPDLHMPLDNGDETWLWKIKCFNSKCLMKPETPYVAIRKTTRYSIPKLKEKINKLAYWWNTGNDCGAYEKLRIVPDAYNEFLEKQKHKANVN